LNVTETTYVIVIKIKERLLIRESLQLLRGHLWVYSNEHGA